MIKVHRYISTLDLAEKMMDLMQQSQRENRQDIFDAISGVVMPAINAIDTDAVAVVRTGRWNLRSEQREEFNNELVDFYLECSECGRRVPIKEEDVTEYIALCNRYPFCHCGAYMDPAEK